MRGLTRFFTLSFVLFGANAMAQQTLVVGVLDTLELNADGYRGSIQWQFSTDGFSWKDVDNATTSRYSAVVDELPGYFRAKIDEEGCEVSHYSEIITLINETDVELWSEPTTWRGAKPEAGEEVTIEVGKYVVLDENPPPLGGLTIKGTLQFDEQDLELVSESISVEGLLRIGSDYNPFTQKAVITLTGTNTNDEANTRGITVLNGGVLELHGATSEVLWTKIDQHGTIGATAVSLENTVDWKTGDEIVLAPTDYYRAGTSNESVTQKVVVTSIEDNILNFDEGLHAFRWGLLQYATSDGMSLSSSNLLDPPVADTDSTTTPLVLDERAEIGNLTRNIVIQAPDDDLWNNVGFGAHTMIMNGGVAHVDGVEFRRGGQRGKLRRYPIHWHMLSYQGTQTLQDANGQYIRNSSINSSRNRGIVIHGTNGILIQNNVIYDIQGHGIFTEDAVERRNVFDGNLVLMVRNPPFGTALKQHETGAHGSSSFWISNPDNTVTNNTAADSESFGFWLAFPEQPWGESINVLHSDGLLLRPNRIQFGTFSGNVAHSVRQRGIMLDDVEMDNQGNTSGAQYFSTSNGREPSWPFETLRRFELSRTTVYKCGHNGFWDRSTWPDTRAFVSADNCGRFFAGAGADGVIERSLLVGTSLNHAMNGTGREELGLADFYEDNPGFVPSAFATYHHTFSMRDNVIIEFPLVEDERSGVFDTGDLYIRAVEKGQIRNTNNLLVNAHPGHKKEAPFNYFTLASAVWDPYGIWGPAENFVVYDDPFLTYGKEVTAIEPGAGSGGVSVSGPFYGFEGFVLHGVGDVLPQNQSYLDLWGIHVRRLDDELNEVATWSVAQATNDLTLNHMRDFATTPDAIYELTFPTSDPATNFHVNVDNMLTGDDTQILGVEFDGSIAAIEVFTTVFGSFDYYQEVGSLQEVRDSEGATYWQDVVGDRVWVKIRGGVWQFWTENPEEGAPNFEDLTYETFQLVIRPE
ncbi:MAG: G8 domain-containing protein [Cyclobacteriaceae bacterium]